MCLTSGKEPERNSYHSAPPPPVLRRLICTRAHAHTHIYIYIYIYIYIFIYSLNSISLLPLQGGEGPDGVPGAAQGEVGGVVLRGRRAALLVRDGGAGCFAQALEGRRRQGQDAAEAAPARARQIGGWLHTGEIKFSLICQVSNHRSRLGC